MRDQGLGVTEFRDQGLGFRGFRDQGFGAYRGSVRVPLKGSIGTLLGFRV